MHRGLERFLNADSDGNVPIVDTDNPARWGKLALTLAFSVVAQLSIGIQRVLQAIYATISDVITGVTEFFAGSGAITLGQASDLELAESLGIIGFLGRDAQLFIASVWNVSLGAVPDILQLPAAIAVLLGTYWIVSQGLEYAREEVF